jgi:2-keto-4-pentenoate hydratase/2-oxohepta-3-ene-1,7-dioic acid hydratase in catechol pathway
MRLATILEGGHPSVAVVREAGLLPLAMPTSGVGSMREIAASGTDGLRRIAAWADEQPKRAYRPLQDAILGPSVPDPGAIFTIGLNYRVPGESATARPERPLVYGKLPTAVAGHGSTLTWDRSLTAEVDPEAELGVVIGTRAESIESGDAMRHVFGYSCVNDISSRDPWLDGDQWLLGKSMAGFCPSGPWIVTADELDPANLRLGCTMNGVAIQDGTTADLRFSIAEIVSYLSHHTVLMPGDLIATGTPARLAGPMGPDRHLQAGDAVTVWIEGIGELSTTII